MTGKPSLPRRVLGLAAEAAMVVFAVLVALGFEEWRDERQLREFADRIEGAIVAEIEANLAELDTTAVELAETSRRIGDALEADDLTLLRSGLDVTLPDFSTAAWRTAQATDAAPYLDYEWVIQVSRAYEAYAIYSRIADGVVDALTSVIGGGLSRERLQVIHGRLIVLVDVHGQVTERLRLALERRPSP